MGNTRILIAEDEADIAELLGLHLRNCCDELVVLSDGSEALKRAQTEAWSLVVLDINLPGKNGLDVCREIRENDPQIPIMMVTAKSSEFDRVLGLETGADDYVSKPFSIFELVARAKALLRRAGLGNTKETKPLEKSQPIVVGELRIDLDRRGVSLNGHDIDLTAREFTLLEFFASHPERVFQRVQLLDHVWGYGHEGYEHTVNSHINRLRAKIEKNPADPKIIQTVWGVGYKFSKTGLCAA